MIGTMTISYDDETNNLIAISFTSGQQFVAEENSIQHIKTITHKVHPTNKAHVIMYDKRQTIHGDITRTAHQHHHWPGPPHKTSNYRFASTIFIKANCVTVNKQIVLYTKPYCSRLGYLSARSK